MQLVIFFSLTFIVCCVVSVLITIIVIVAISFKSLDDNEVGIHYNPNAVSIDEETLYERGTTFLGPGHRFIIFKKN